MLRLRNSRVWATVQELGGQGDFTPEEVTMAGGFFRGAVCRYLRRLEEAHLIHQCGWKRNLVTGDSSSGQPAPVYRLGSKPKGFHLKPFVPLTNEQRTKAWRRRNPGRDSAYREKIRHESPEERQQRAEQRRQQATQRKTERALKLASKAVEKVGADPLSAFLYGRKS